VGGTPGESGRCGECCGGPGCVRACVCATRRGGCVRQQGTLCARGRVAAAAACLLNTPAGPPATHAHTRARAPRLRQVIELPLKHPELFESLGIAQPKVGGVRRASCVAGCVGCVVWLRRWVAWQGCARLGRMAALRAAAGQSVSRLAPGVVHGHASLDRRALATSSADRASRCASTHAAGRGCGVWLTAHHQCVAPHSASVAHARPCAPSLVRVCAAVACRPTLTLRMSTQRCCARLVCACRTATPAAPDAPGSVERRSRGRAHCVVA
jgi:hypothetical protein